MWLDVTLKGSTSTALRLTLKKCLIKAVAWDVSRSNTSWSGQLCFLSCPYHIIRKKGSTLCHYPRLPCPSSQSTACSLLECKQCGWMTTSLSRSLDQRSIAFTAVDRAFHFFLSSMKSQKRTPTSQGFTSLGPAGKPALYFRPCNSSATCWKNYLIFSSEPYDNFIINLQCMFLRYRGNLK